MNIFTSDQERLASLVKEDREILNPGEMMWDNLKKSINLDPSQLNKINGELQGEMYQGYLKTSTSNLMTSQVAQNQQVPQSKAPKSISLPENMSAERILEFLFGHYDDLVDLFERSGIDSDISKDLVEIIHGLESCITYMGGQITEFDPFNHSSGLDVPDFYKNANKVIETTKQCYKAGSIREATVEENGTRINITFIGKYKGIVDYVVYGVVSAESWNGNEAIDYIYSPEGGKMSVKVFDNGKWNDRSLSGKYAINWDIEEKDLDKVTEEKEIENTVENNVAEKENTEQIEQVEKQEEKNNLENINPVKEDIIQEENKDNKKKENLAQGNCRISFL